MSYLHAALATLAILLACSRPADRSETPAEPPAETPAPPPEDAMSRMLKTPEPPRNFVDGPPIEPPDQLLKWLETAASAEPRPRIRLPVVVRFSSEHRIGLDGGHIGVSPAALPGVISVTFDDTAMGVSLLDRIRHACPDEKQTTCAVWLEGTWAGGPRHQIRVFSVVGVNPPEPPAGGAPIRARIVSNAG